MSMDEDTRQHIVSAAQWLINPEEKTGLLLCGLCGNGKTTLATSIARLIAYVTEKEFGYSQRKTMPLYTGKDICELKANTKAYDDYKKVLSEEMIIIDDMGHEPSEVQSFGMTHTPVVDVIEHRYRKNLMTIITTNLLPDELSEKYQIRVYDRLKEMMKVIPFRNESYRD